MYTHICINMCICIHLKKMYRVVYVYVNIYMYYKYMYTHKYIYIYIYTHIICGARRGRSRALCMSSQGCVSEASYMSPVRAPGRAPAASRRRKSVYTPGGGVPGLRALATGPGLPTLRGLLRGRARGCATGIAAPGPAGARDGRGHAEGTCAAAAALIRRSSRGRGLWSNVRIRWILLERRVLLTRREARVPPRRLVCSEAAFR